MYTYFCEHNEWLLWGIFLFYLLFYFHCFLFFVFFFFYWGTPFQVAAARRLRSIIKLPKCWQQF